MTDITWISAKAELGARRTSRGPGRTATLAGLWNRAVLEPLHRALDAGLRAGELRELGPASLADIGYRRG